MVFAMLLQFATILSGFIIPRLILENFGSNVNGLINSLTQFLNYISLLEGGIGSVLMAVLYKPLANRDNLKLSSIIKTASSFFRKLSWVFLGYTLVVAVIYPFIKNEFSFGYISSLTLILGINLFMQYNFSLTWRIMLKADRKVYISAGIDTLVIILNTIFTVVAIRIYPEIHFVKIIAAIAYIIQPLLYGVYINGHYEIDRSIPENKDTLEQRWDGFGINLAAFLNNNTDVILLTLFTTLSNVSIYAVYSLVTMGICSLIKSISTGMVPTIGKLYAEKDETKMKDYFISYENLIFFCTFSIYTVAMILIVPFVMNYTNGITDANYNQKTFSILIVLSSAIFCIREPYVNMAYLANKFREISKWCYAEAVINVVLSIIFVYKWGLNGVAIGTLCAMTYRTVFHILFLRNKIINRSPLVAFGKLALFASTSVIAYVICNKTIRIYLIDDWYNWIISAVICSVIVAFVNILPYLFIKKSKQKL